MPEGRDELARIIGERSILICCGSGGAGKTTAAAAMALAAAASGRRACVVTIDPARRLANALGVDSLTNSASRIEGPWKGELWAVMLDAKTTFDDLVIKYSTDVDQAERIMRNRLYRNLTSGLAGTQEYMAAEKLYELHQEGNYDIVVVDTPPTRNALDFIDAPGRLTRFLENRVFRLLLVPTRAYLKAVSVATEALLRAISKVAGSEMVEDAIAFFRAFEGMEAGFRDRARRVEQLLTDPGTGFVLIAAPRRDSVADASHFAAKLAESQIVVQALVVNRVHPSFDEAEPDGPMAEADHFEAEVPSERLAEAWSQLTRNLQEFRAVAAREDAYVSDLADQVAPAPMVRVPFLADDVHDLGGLAAIVRHLTGQKLRFVRGQGPDSQ